MRNSKAYSFAVWEGAHKRGIRPEIAAWALKSLLGL